MNTKRLIILWICAATIVGCKNKKQTLTESEQEQVKLEELYSTEEVLDTVIPNQGIKWPEKRGIDPQHPPVLVNIETVAENDELDLSRFYTQAEYVKLKHPLAEQGIAFLGNSNYEVTYERGATMGSGANSRVYLTGNNIVAGDNFFGYHCFDPQGNFVYTIASRKELPSFNVKTNTASLHWSPSMDMIAGLSIFNDNCLILKMENQKSTFNFHNITARKNYLTRPTSYGQFFLISPETYVEYAYSPLRADRMPLLRSFDMRGDTLAQFMNYNSLPEAFRGNFTNPENSDFYLYNNQLTMRQAYNDTIFRVSADKMTPAFVLDMGHKKPDVQTALKGDKADKIFVAKLLETEDFLFIVHSENYDCPNNRKSGAVKFFYSYYDKNAQKRYSVPSFVFPEMFALKNGIGGAIPLLLSNTATYNDKLYAAYTKTQLKEMMESSAFSSFPPVQQEQVKAFHDELSDYELLVMILK